MEKRKTSVRYAPEVRARAVRMVLEHGGNYASQWEAIGSILPSRCRTHSSSTRTGPRRDRLLRGSA